MAVRDIFKVSRKTFFNPRAWSNYDEFVNLTRGLWRSLQGVIIPPTPGALKKETFEQAMLRNESTEADLAENIKNFRLFTWIFLLLGFIAFVYAFFLLFAYSTFTGWLLGMSVCALLLSQAFKFDFWSLQLRRRNLKLTFEDWKESVLGKK